MRFKANQSALNEKNEVEGAYSKWKKKGWEVV